MNVMESPTRPQQRPRSKSGFSFRSHNSADSTSSKPIVDNLKETPEERRKTKFGLGKGYTNPNRAINEAQPTFNQEETTLSPLRNMEHKDRLGNTITDPDLSNPSRPRLERPLDTIRSFHAAADSAHKRRSHASRPESVGDMLQGNDSNRSSVIGTDMNIHPRSQAALPSSMAQYYSGGSRRASWQQDGHQGYLRGPPSSFRRGMVSRQASAPLPSRPYQAEHNGYPNHAYNESYETNGESTGSPSEPWGTSTNPSSENSSIDRIHAYNRQENDAYGPQHNTRNPSPPKKGPGNGPIAEEGGWYNGHSYNENRAYNSPPPPQHYPRPNRDAGPRQQAPGPMRQSKIWPHPQSQMQQQPRRNVIPLSEPIPMPNGRPIGRPNGRPVQAPPQRPNALKKNKSNEKEKRPSWLRRKLGLS